MTLLFCCLFLNTLETLTDCGIAKFDANFGRLTSDDVPRIHPIRVEDGGKQPEPVTSCTYSVTEIGCSLQWGMGIMMGREWLTGDILHSGSAHTRGDSEKVSASSCVVLSLIRFEAASI